MIQAIPTTYNGIKFRSRAEARWAVFFDKAGISFRYEAEGYQTASGWYLPDFELSEAPRQTFFEVKPGQPTQSELALLSALARGAQAHVFVTLGPPEPGCVIWKVFADGTHKKWHLGRDHRWLVCFLTDAEGIHTLPIRKDAVPQSLDSLGAARELTAAQQYQFPLFDEGPVVRGARDRRDWKQRERAVLNARTAELREVRRIRSR